MTRSSGKKRSDLSPNWREIMTPCSVCNNHPTADGTTMCVSCINKGDRRNG